MFRCMDWAQRALAECVDMVSVHDSYGLYLYASPAFERFLGWRPEELVGHTAYDYFHPDDVEEIGKSHGDTLYEWQPTVVTYRIRRADGGYEWVETTSRTIEREATDRGTIFTVTRPIGHRQPDTAKAALVHDPRHAYVR